MQKPCDEKPISQRQMGGCAAFEYKQADAHLIKVYRKAVFLPFGKNSATPRSLRATDSRSFRSKPRRSEVLLWGGPSIFKL
jgi:hypothetical protein